MTETNSLEGGDDAVAQASASDGNEAMDGIASPAFNADGTVKQPEAKKEEKKAPPATQPTEKDQRHFAKKIQQDFDAKLRLAKKLVSKDPDAIYDLIDEDETLVTHILKTDDSFKAKTIDELRALRQSEENGEQDPLIASTNQKLVKIEAQLAEERILRLKGQFPDLRDDVEDKFREMYSDERFSDYEPEELYVVAKALTKKSSTKPNANDVALDMLQSQEGALPSSGGGSGTVKAKSKLTNEQKNRLQQFGHSEADLDKYLPPNIDKILGIA